MPFEVVLDATLSQVTLGVRQRSSGHLAVLTWSTTQVGGAMILRTSGEVNRNGLGCM
jgi:hypothetical protein